jgi:hypothetical protein
MAARRRTPGRGHVPGEDVLEDANHATEPLNLDGRAAVASEGAVLTDRGIANLQRVAGNQATRSLIERETLQREPEDSGTAIPLDQAQAPPPEESWDGSVESNFGENKSLYHTINNFGDQQLRYLLRINNTGYALLSLETQYEFRGEPQRAWTAISAQRGKTEEVTNGLPPHSVLHLRLFGERDHTQPDQSSYAGTLQVRRAK